MGVWGASHPAGFMREGTKAHEEVFRGTLQECLQLLQGSGLGERHHPTKGEFTVVVGPTQGAG